MADTDIIEFYPNPMCVHDRMREMFAGYGTCDSMNVKPLPTEAVAKKNMRHSSQKYSSFMQENLSVEFECQTTRSCSNKLSASQPSYPLLPPNACTQFFTLLIFIQLRQCFLICMCCM